MLACPELVRVDLPAIIWDELSAELDDNERIFQPHDPGEYRVPYFFMRNVAVWREGSYKQAIIAQVEDQHYRERDKFWLDLIDRRFTGQDD